MIRKILTPFMAVILLSSCSNELQKKVLIIGKGDLQVNGKNITMKTGSGYAEKEVPLEDKEAAELVAETEAGSQKIPVPAEKGYYILNLKSDTIAGSRQLFGKDLSNNKVMTQEDLKLKIDSLENMVAGSNINSQTNFRILPNQAVRITDNLDARVYGPYHKIPAQLEVGPDNKEPEIYKFYTNEELRELIENLKKLTF